MKQTQERIQAFFAENRERFHWSNPMQSPRIEKVVISVGTGRIRKDAQRIKLIQERLALITGQKLSPRIAKKSIASFKLRKGEVIGYAATLRGNRMISFLDRLCHIALPRTRDFQGIPKSAVDTMGNLSIGIREHTVFPEVADENLHDVFSFSVTIVTTTSDSDVSIAFLKAIGIPFVREEEKES